jgi:hypothetical protein
MTATRYSRALFVALGMPLVVAGLVTSRSDAMILGLPSDFLAGFLMSAGIVIQLVGIVVSTHAATRRE